MVVNFGRNIQYRTMHPATNGGKDFTKGGMNFQYLIDLGT